MFIPSWFSRRTMRQHKGRTQSGQSRTSGHRGKRLRFEQLEGRAMLSSWTAANVANLIADIDAANAAGGTNTVALVVGNTFTLTTVNNTTDGATGIPVIVANNNLTIQGNGDTIRGAQPPEHLLSASSTWPLEDR